MKTKSGNQLKPPILAALFHFFRRHPRVRLMTAALIPCFVALLVYLPIAEDPQPFPDSRDYLDLSCNLVDLHRYHSSFDTTATGEGSLIRTPGYPGLIAMLRPLAGSHAFLIVNLAALFSAVFFSLKIAGQLNIRTRTAMVILFALSPGLIVCTVSALTEVPFAGFLTPGIYLLLLGNPILAGLCFSFATLIRPAGLYLFILPALWLGWKQRRFLPVILFVIAANLLPAAWTMRNYLRFGTPVYSTLGGHYLLEYKAGSYLSWRDNVPWTEMSARLNQRLNPQASPIAQNQQAEKIARKILLDNALGFIWWTPRNLIYFLMPDLTPLLERLHLTLGNRGTLDILRRQGPVAAVKFYFSGNPVAAALMVIYSLFYLATLLLLPLGIRELWRQKRYAPLLLLGGVIIYLWVIPVGNLDWRFRMPAAPLLFVLATAGIPSLIRGSQHLFHRRSQSQ